MGKRASKESESSGESSRASEHEADHAPRVYTAREQFVFAVKLVAIVGLVIFLLWLMDRFV